MNAETLTFKTEEEWLAARNQGITATDIPTIVGANPYKSAYKLWLEKRGDISRDDLSQNQKVQWGKTQAH